MITTWILLIAVYSGGSVSAEFNSKEACQAAASEAKKQADIRSTPVFILCAKK